MESQQQVFLILNISTVYLAAKQDREKALISLEISLGFVAEQYPVIKVPFGRPNAHGFRC
jgi:hypothetical protein